MEREKPSPGLLLEATPKVMSVPHSSKRVELRMGNGISKNKLESVKKVGTWQLS